MAVSIAAASEETQRDQRRPSNPSGWTQHQKERLLVLDEEERAKGKGFMDRVKKRWEDRKSVV